jgi:hypothetical protein
MEGARSRARGWLAGLALAALVAAVAPGEARACFNAYHARRIVLGSSGGAVVVLELDWKRDDRGPGETLRWRGPVRVGLLAAPGAKLRGVRELPVADFKLGRHLDDAAVIKREIRAGLAAARSYPGFRAVGLPEHRSCEFQRSCERVRIAVESGEIALIVTQKGAPLEVPVTLPKDGYFDDVDDSPPTKEELLSWLRLVSILSYDIDGREVLVVDLGGGDEESGESEDGLWPPCGCNDVARCPPVAATMHHGTQFEVVVPLTTAPGPRAAMPPAAPAATTRIDAGELLRAQDQPKAAVRTDGLFAAEPTCTVAKGWTRRFFRFFPDGTVRQLDANVTPQEAFRLTNQGSPWVFPSGKYKLIGERVSATIGEDEHYVDRRTWTLEGLVEGDVLRALSGAAGVRATPATFRFIPLKVAPLK